jgi:hypothetical protein
LLLKVAVSKPAWSGFRWPGLRDGWIESDCIAIGDAMVRHANYDDPFHVLLRVNRAVLLALLWAALAACVVGSLAADIVDWMSAWRGLRIVLLTSFVVV